MKRKNLHKKEQNQLQRLQYENQKLKKQISSLRKQMSRIDIDRYSHLKDLIELDEANDAPYHTKDALEDLKRKWECHTCGKDYLRLIVVPRLDGMFYFRRCQTCMHKTKLKKYEDGIEGIENDNTIHPKNQEPGSDS